MTFQWKQDEVLKSESVVVKAGTWHGNNSTDDGKPYVSVISREQVREIYESIPKGSVIPIYVDLHGRRERIEPDGYAVSFGITSDGEQMVHRGFIHNPEAQKAMVNGEDECSPEFTTRVNGDGSVTRKLDAICYVPNSAMKNDVNYMFEKFEEADNNSASGNNSTDQNSAQNTGDNKDSGSTGSKFDNAFKKDADPVDTQKPVDINEIVNLTTTKVVEALKPFLEMKQQSGGGGDNKQIEEKKGDDKSGKTVDAETNAKLVAQEAMINSLYDDKINDLILNLKVIGVSDPISLVPDGAPKAAVVDYLKKMIEIKQTTMNMMGVPNNLGADGPGSATKNEFESVMKDLGFSDKKYLDMFPEMYQ